MVELRKDHAPVERSLDDARAAALTTEMPEDVKSRVVPGLCRTALEAAANESIRRRRLRAGQPHGEIEKLLEPLGLIERLALAPFDDEAKGGKVMPPLDDHDRRFADAVRACKEGAHGKTIHIDLKALVDQVKHIAEMVRKK